MNTTFRTTLLLGAGMALVALGCRAKERVENRLDPPSLVRLSAVAEAGRVVVACRATPLPEKLPAPDAILLGRTGSSLLLEIPKASIGTLSGIPGLERASVWGESGVVAKMDSRLKEELLAAWDEERVSPIGLLARFADASVDLKQVLSEQGATPRTVAGPVVTLDADPETILRIIMMPGLLSLNLPNTVRPLN